MVSVRDLVCSWIRPFLSHDESRPAHSPSDGFDEVGRFASALIVAEYESLRGESARSLDRAHGAIQWSLSAFGVLYASAVAAIARIFTGPPSAPMVAVVFVTLSLGLPGLLCVGAWTWLSELSRMERAGAVLRCIERDVANIPGIGSFCGGAPLRFETEISKGRAGGVGAVRKMGVWYVAISALFFGGILISEATLIIVFYGIYRNVSANGRMLGWASIFVALVILVIFVTVSFWMKRFIYDLADIGS